MTPKDRGRGQTELSFWSGAPAEPRREDPRPAALASPPQPAIAIERPEAEPQKGRSAPELWSVGALVRGANALLEARYASVWVEGEVVGLKVAAGGHAYFALKDDEASLPTAMWKTAVERLRFRLEDGQKLRVRGRLGVFVKTGRFQFYADRAEPSGLGALMLELEQRKKRLAAEGLFEVARKRRLPAWPQCVGVVTSSHGAALHDILKVARRRCPGRIVLSPAVVQGPDAPASIRRALARLLRCVPVDVVIVGRGGGSIEDLWAFNDEALARDLAACPVPVVSAVGHEVDITICDLVADVRAATPSQAAELVVPDRVALRERIDGLERRLTRRLERVALDARVRLDQSFVELSRSMRQRLGVLRGCLRGHERALGQHHPRARCARDRRRLQALVQRMHGRGQALGRVPRGQLARLEERLRRAGPSLPRALRREIDVWVERLRRRGPARVAEERLRLARAVGALDAMSPLAVLARGYAVVRRENGDAVRESATLRLGERVELRFHQGRAHATVDAIAPEPASASGPEVPAPVRHEDDEEGSNHESR